MRNCFFLSLFVLVFAISSAGAEGTEKHSVTRAEGFVPNQETAIAIAVAVWLPIYGKENIERQKPYVASLVNGVWVVEGTWSKDYTHGGVAIAEISKSNGKVLRVSHGK
jgi:hypothetical protein